MSKKMKTALVVTGLALSVNFAATDAQAYYINDYAVPVAVTSHAQNVASIQNTLSNLGYFVGHSGITGTMNKSTRNAVKQFQADNGLKVDGIVGIHTARILNGALVNRTALAPTAVRYNSVGYNYVPTKVRYQPTTNGIYW